MAKSTTIKRILKEAAELSTHPSPDYAAHPVSDSNLLEWHFTLRGPPGPSPFADGLYHGRISLPPTYPLRPPSFRFLTPSGRFEPNREICLSMSSFHEETWQPAWGIRTALVALRSFMDEDAKGQVGGIETGPEVRARLAAESRRWRCAVCGKTCEEMLPDPPAEEKERAAEEEVEVPKELRLGYREDIAAGAAQPPPLPAGSASNSPRAPSPGDEAQPRLRHAVTNEKASRATSSAPPPPPPTRTTPLPPPPPQPAAPAPNTSVQVPSGPHDPRTAVDPVLPWLDHAIWTVAAALLVLLVRQFL